MRDKIQTGGGPVKKSKRRLLRSSVTGQSEPDASREITAKVRITNYRLHETRYPATAKAGAMGMGEAAYRDDFVRAGQSLADIAEASIVDAAEGAPLPPVHPGEVLLEEFIRPNGLSPIRTATRLGVPRTRIERLVTGTTSMTDDTALRLERLFGASAEFWMNLQTTYDLALARQGVDASIQAIIPLEPPAA